MDFYYNINNQEKKNAPKSIENIINLPLQNILSEKNFQENNKSDIDKKCQIFILNILNDSNIKGLIVEEKKYFIRII